MSGKLCDCDKALAKQVAWKYIMMKNSSYAKVAKEFDISSTKVGTILRDIIPEVSTFLDVLVTWKRKKNEKRAQKMFQK